MSRKTWFMVAAAVLALGGCTSPCEYIQNGCKVGPNYCRPPAPIAKSWIEASDIRVRTEADDLSKWWTVFNDPILDALICEAYQQNLTLREAGFRVLAARDQLGIAIGEIFPQQQFASGSFTQKEVSLQVANRVATPQRAFGTWAVGFGLAWELDFWGRFRRAIESADDTLSASVEDFDDVLVTLLGDVATNYVELRTLQQQLEYVRINVSLQQEVLGIAKAQFEGGQVSELDVDQAQSTLQITQSQVPQLEIQIRQTMDRLCILLGIPMDALQGRLSAAPIPTAPPTVAVGMPADLLRRRPDVRREERLAAAQCAQIGVAEADFYPAISVLGTIGYAAQNLPQLFTSQAFNGTIGPSFQWNILNYGRILNNVRLQDAKFQEQIAKYQNTVLKADAEVEDGVATFLQAHIQTQFASGAVSSAEKAVKVAIAQYKGGTVDFNRVALLEQNLVGYQNDLALARGQIALGLIQVYKGLGGGWQIRLNGCDAPVNIVTSPSSSPQLVLPPLNPARAAGGGPISQTSYIRMDMAPNPLPDSRARLGSPAGH